MSIHLVCLEDGITATGFRKMAGYVERLEPTTRTFYVSTDRYRTLLKSITRRFGEVPDDAEVMVDEIAHGIAGAEVIGFSSMTGYSALTKAVIARVRAISPGSFLIWGGIHPIIHPEEAITADVDAICTGEGEFAFEEFLDHYRRGADFTAARNFWFKRDGRIVRNGFRPLMTSEEMETLPLPKYGGDEWIFRAGHGFVPVRRRDYLANDGLGYPAIWSIGCPLHCTFCGNTVFIANDKNYKRLRHPSASYIIREVQRAREVHPHLSTVLFFDDSFLAIPLQELTEFATAWRVTLGLPFAVYGVIPTYVRPDKLEVLTWAGLNRVRMGIQSGSDRILRFYKRPTPVARIEQAAQTIASFSRYHINPSYDIIVDNPIETRQDVLDTLELVYRLERPFTLNIFSLRIIPNTVLERQMREEGIDVEQINDNYLALRPTFANVVLTLLLVWRPPRRIFDRLLTRVRAYSEPQPHYPLLLHALRIPWLILQGCRHVRFADFSLIPGYPGYMLWRLGVLSVWKRLFVRRAARPSHLAVPVLPPADAPAG